MIAKTLELRDRATFIPVLAVDMNPTMKEEDGWDDDTWKAQRYLLRRSGYSCNGRTARSILLTRLCAESLTQVDPNCWGGRTFPTAHKYIIEHWEELRDGDVIDVQFILGETTEKATSEQINCPLE